MIKLPARRYPGVLLQGDSLAVLVQDLLDVRAALERRDTDVAGEELDDVIERLHEIKSTYERALSDHDMDRPYS